jgi:hypothetical protein
MEKLTLGNFATGLNAQIGEHGSDEIESIEQTSNGYTITTKANNGDSIKLLIDASTTNSVVNQVIDDEIAEYSIKENVGYMALVASRLIFQDKIRDIPLPELVTNIIQIAEDFDMEYGSEMVGDDTVNAINKFTEQRLLEQFGK